jgi:hypothetical protein
LALLVTLLVGIAVGLLNTLDGNFGKGPTREFGFPFTFRVEIEPMGPPGGPPPRFDLLCLAANLGVAGVMLASSFFVAQVAGNRWGRPSRLTVRSLVMLVAASALVLASLRFALVLAWLILVSSWLYGMVSPLVAVMILIVNAFGRSPFSTGPSRDGTEPPSSLPPGDPTRLE